MKPFLQWAAIFSLGAALVGCGGGGGGIVTPTATPTTRPTTTPTLTGKQAIRAVMTSGYQTFQASVNYPFAGLQLALPPSSPFKQSQRLQGAAKTRLTAATPQFNSSLGLYITSSTTGNTTTIRYYTDAAGTQSAGTSTLTAPGGNIVGDNYSSYPVVIQIRQNVTGGNIPCIGSGTITIADSKGKNSIKGTLNLPKTGLTVTADLSLSDAGQIGGTATIVGNGQTISLTNLSGDFSEDWTGNARVSPDGATGTAIINVFTGKFVVNLQTKDGAATSSRDSSGALNIVFPDRVGEKLLSPLLIVAGQGPDSPTPTSTPTPRPTATPIGNPTSTPRPTPTPQPTSAPLYQVPVALASGINPLSLNNKNQVVGSPSNSTPGVVFLASPTASLQTLQGSTNVTLIDFNNNGAILTRNNGDGNLAFLPSFTATPQIVPSNLQTLAFGLGDTGAFVGQTSSSGSDGLIRAQALYWKNATTAPVTIPSPAGEDLTRALSVNEAGQIGGVSGKATTGISVPVFWSSSTATPQKLKAFSGQGFSFDVVKVNTRANILVTSAEGISAYYSSATAQPVVLPDLTPSRISNVGGARDINASGVAVGTSLNTAAQSRAVRWTNGQVQDLNSLIPSNSGWVLERAQSINDSGAIVGRGTLNGRFTYFYVAPRQ